MPFAPTTPATAGANSWEAKRVSKPTTRPRSARPCAFRNWATLWAQTRTLAKVKSSAMTPRQPSVPNLIGLSVIGQAVSRRRLLLDERLQSLDVPVKVGLERAPHEEGVQERSHGPHQGRVAHVPRDPSAAAPAPPLPGGAGGVLHGADDAVPPHGDGAVRAHQPREHEGGGGAGATVTADQGRQR